MRHQQPGLTRRGFALGLGGVALANRLFAAGEPLPWSGPATVHKVFLGIPQPTWPRPDLDVMQEKAKMESLLAGVERRNRNPSSTLCSAKWM